LGERKVTVLDGYRGLYLIGDKATGRATNVQVVDAEDKTYRMPFLVYVQQKIEPNYTTLPWWEDVDLSRH
jgi:hypothetical protein